MNKVQIKGDFAIRLETQIMQKSQLNPIAIFR